MKTIYSLFFILFFFSVRSNAQERRFYALNIHSKANPDLYIKYMADLGENGTYFLYEYKNDDVSPHQISLSENYRLVDERTGKTYYPTEKSLEGNVNVFPKTTHTFFVRFPSLPRLNYVSFYENDCLKTNDFCLTNLSLAEADEVTESLEDIAEIIRIIAEGSATATVSFYMNVQSSDVNIYVDDVFYGTLNQYFKSSNYKPNCGEKGTFPVKLEPGFHTFSGQSVDGKNTWKGSFNLKENQCLSQGLVK